MNRGGIFAVLLGVGTGSLAGAERADIFAETRLQVEPAVSRALAFLDREANPDRTFSGSHGKSTGIVSLVGMAFLSAGHLPQDPEQGARVRECIDFVLDHQKPDGLLDSGDGGNGPMYAHTISTLFLSEVSGMVAPARQERLSTALPKAMQRILDAQAVPKEERHAGGWRYRPDSRDSDLSCSGWALMALRSARLNGAPVPERAFRAATGYLRQNFDEQRGRFGYQNTVSHAETLSGAGLLCLVLTGTPPDDPALRRVGDTILATTEGDRLAREQHALYGNYYNAQGMFQLGGGYWERYYRWMTGYYLPQQKPDGAWSSSLGDVYGTVMATLALTVPYRCLPIYQRDETVE